MSALGAFALGCGAGALLWEAFHHSLWVGMTRHADRSIDLVRDLLKLPPDAEPKPRAGEEG